VIGIGRCYGGARCGDILTYDCWRIMKKALQVVFVDAYPPGTTDFSTILTRVRAANPDVLGVATSVLEDGVAIIRQMKALNVSPRMVGFTPSVSPPRLYEVLGRDAEFVYVASVWVPELVEIRAGGLIPIARQYPSPRRRGASVSEPVRQGVDRGSPERLIPQD
jgi:hypothetical protein